MKREEILEKSRKENAGQDLYEKEIVREGGEVGIYVVLIMALVLFLIEMYVNDRARYELWAMFYSLMAAGYTVRLKASRKKRWQEILPAAAGLGAVLLEAAMYFRNLLGAAAML
ncbi:hypothetical protein FMM80_02580 [Schaedlerella arabinosiphila]|uniref:Uncharacterized protein n=1 Tax=Schaedlerella arabinosiphila TaxID=2044587 RepID=A0A9X5C4Y6_9FIRM|nr:DUF6442 family protein [Schaedlerella arabinosiphila]NDO67670.1 hypothetical protein [Schaedlerella arabinosiphila]